ncbi:serine dehydratase subunit alpha family protein [Xylanibacter caecicola]|uniref:L-cysteine desulfidase family protein n=1 Tax=Xylanibacter caecicola TaxID=2736294 RepID=UPI00258331FE|nr:L-serine ammonia-lyase, iron-sulfur-dependent, subunit alpha [Xylanibacter caecicola]
MITDAERSAITALIRSQVVPAIGCTEPVSVALCVARASALMGHVPDSIELSLSLNILKNAMGVGIPGTGMVGLPIAVALGAISGRHELGLEVLRDTDAAAVEKARRYVDEGRINIALEEHDDDKLFIRVLCKSGEDETEAIIKGHHTDFVYLRKNCDVLLEKQAGTVSEESICVPLTLRKVYEYATTTCTDDIKFILEAKHLNENAAHSGLTENYGHALGKTLCSPLGRGIMGDGIFSRILSVTSCACDARMAGAMVPVMSNSGSGNQGICATMPVVVFAEENHNTEEELIRALVLSNLTAIYIKQALGALSALCGCVVASTGSSCGITYLMGGTYEQVAFSVKNMIANLTGMICDGAKPSCALKLTTGVGTAVMSAMLAIQNKHVTSVEGIIDDDVDRSIHNLTDIGSKGMSETDRFVMNIMTNKTK